MRISVSQRVESVYGQLTFGTLTVRNYKDTAQGLEAFEREATKLLLALADKYGEVERKKLIEQNNEIAAYTKYYRRFKKTYHVLAQIESALKGKGLPSTPGPVRALLLTELTTSLLVAGHDLNFLNPPLSIDLASGDENYSAVGERIVLAKSDDICLRDESGIRLSIVYGQDHASRLTSDTTDILFLIDSVPGVTQKAIENGLKELASFIALLCPTADIEMSLLNQQ